MLIKNGIIIIQGFENRRKDEETQSISIYIYIYKEKFLFKLIFILYRRNRLESFVNI